MNTLDVQKIVVDVSAKPSKFEPRHKKKFLARKILFFKLPTFHPSLLRFSSTLA